MQLPGEDFAFKVSEKVKPTTLELKQLSACYQKLLTSSRRTEKIMEWCVSNIV